MITAKRNFGDMGEKAAIKFLQKENYQILDTNYQNKFGRRLGEIDIIAKDRKTNELVFVEVKTRELQKYQDTLPEENITYSKLKRLEKISQAYLRQKKLDDYPFRFDAISVWLDLSSNKAEIKHISHL